MYLTGVECNDIVIYFNPASLMNYTDILSQWPIGWRRTLKRYSFSLVLKMLEIPSCDQGFFLCLFSCPV